MYWITSNIKDNGHNNHNYSKQLSYLVVLVMTVPNQREGGARSEDFFRNVTPCVTLESRFMGCFVQ